ncbi:MAG: hypothetical protein KDD61_02000 [Bdellovibrionales bacterium]|nr:hypothetical protein [Bdellovibrionales bacterium]
MKVDIEKTEQGTKVTLTGRITEDSDFGLMPSKDDAPLVIDMQNVTRINSCGLRFWVIWMNDLGKDTQVTLQNCPQWVVDQINILEGFVGNNTVVESFYVPYYCEDCELSESVFKKQGVDFELNNVDAAIQDWEDQPPKCPQCSGDMDLDAVSSKYFSFLK